MRQILWEVTGLIYLDNKLVGDIKLKVKTKKMTYLVNDKCIKCKLMDCVNCVL